jgi:starvation-inducible DNA-binding protein
MSTSTITRTDRSRLKEPIVPSTRGRTQALGLAGRNPLTLEAAAAASSVDSLNQLLADSLALRDLYEEHPRQASGPNFYSLHLLFDKHFEEQSELVDLLAERVETLGDISIPLAPDVAEATLIPPAPQAREDIVTQIARLLQVHEAILVKAWAMARGSVTAGDRGTDDIIVSYLIRTNESQAWFLALQMQ